jgi:hypothetical protein
VIVAEILVANHLRVPSRHASDVCVHAPVRLFDGFVRSTDARKREDEDEDEDAGDWVLHRAVARAATRCGAPRRGVARPMRARRAFFVCLFASPDTSSSTHSGAGAGAAVSS